MCVFFLSSSRFAFFVFSCFTSLVYVFQHFVCFCVLLFFFSSFSLEFDKIYVPAMPYIEWYGNGIKPNVFTTRSNLFFVEFIITDINQLLALNKYLGCTTDKKNEKDVRCFVLVFSSFRPIHFSIAHSLYVSISLSLFIPFALALFQSFQFWCLLFHFGVVVYVVGLCVYIYMNIALTSVLLPDRPLLWQVAAKEIGVLYVIVSHDFARIAFFEMMYVVYIYNMYIFSHWHKQAKRTPRNK